MPESESIFQFEDSNESPGFLLWQVSSLWQRKINAGLRPFGLTHAQFVLLASLTWFAGNDKPLTQVELANHVKMDVMMVSNVLRKLESKELITRKAHPSDTRAKSIAITEQGHILAAQAVRVVENIDYIFFSKLNADINQFNQKLQALISEN